MKRFLGVLIASMFLASAAYAADGHERRTTKEKKAIRASEDKSKAKDAKAEEGQGQRQKGRKVPRTPRAKARQKAKARPKTGQKGHQVESLPNDSRKVALPTFLYHLNPSSDKFPLHSHTSFCRITPSRIQTKFHGRGAGSIFKYRTLSFWIVS